MQKTLEQIRSQLGNWVKTHASREMNRECKESILLKSSCLHGYRFCIGSVQAIWLVGDKTIEIRRDGRLADTLAIADGVAAIADDVTSTAGQFNQANRAA